MKKGENECAMSAPRNQDRMVPPSNATPSRGGPEGGGVPVQTESPDTSVSGGGRPDLVARKASPSTCPHGASPGAQASTRVPKATVYPGVSTHWTSSLEWLQNRRRRGASEREKGKAKGGGACRGRRRRCHFCLALSYHMLLFFHIICCHRRHDIILKPNMCNPHNVYTPPQSS